MSRTFVVSLIALSAMVVSVVSTVSAADMRSLNREATEAFHSGNYVRAAELFSEAGQAAPEDLRLAFNRGSALAAAGKSVEATEILHRSAISPDKEIASKSLTLLGRIAVDRVRQSLSDPPDTTPADQQGKIFEQLDIAEKYYVEAISLDPRNRILQSAVEQIRAWRTHIESLWNLAERQAKRTEDVSERLHWLENWQETIGKAVAKENNKPNTPQKFQTLYENAAEQERLTEEIAVLEDEFRRQLDETGKTAAYSDDGSNAEGEDADDQAALQLIVKELQRLKELSEQTRRQLRDFRDGEALVSGQNLLRRLNRLRMNLAPFEMIVQEAERLQAELCRENSSNAAAAIDSGAEPVETTVPEQAERQRRVASWMPLMVFRAQEQLDAVEQSNAEGQPLLDEQRHPLELAVQFGPKIETSAENAAGSLQNNRPDEALPEQNEALRMLREILKNMPPPQRDQQQNQQQDKQQQQNQQQNADQNSEQDQQQERQQGQQDEQNPNGQGRQVPKEGGENEQEQNRDQQEQDQQDKNQQGNKGRSEQPDAAEENTQAEPDSGNDSKDELSGEQQEERHEDKADGSEKEVLVDKDKRKELEKAERMLRQVRRKQQEADQRRRQLRMLLQQSQPVDRDW